MTTQSLIDQLASRRTPQSLREDNSDCNLEEHLRHRPATNGYPIQLKLRLKPNTLVSGASSAHPFVLTGHSDCQHSCTGNNHNQRSNQRSTSLESPSNNTQPVPYRQASRRLEQELSVFTTAVATHQSIHAHNNPSSLRRPFFPTGFFDLSRARTFVAITVKPLHSTCEGPFAIRSRVFGQSGRSTQLLVILDIAFNITSDTVQTHAHSLLRQQHIALDRGVIVCHGRSSMLHRSTNALPTQQLDCSLHACKPPLHV